MAMFKKIPLIWFILMMAVILFVSMGYYTSRWGEMDVIQQEEWKVNQNVLVLAWTSDKSIDIYDPLSSSKHMECANATSIDISVNRAHQKNADALVFVVPRLQANDLPPRMKDQPWISYTQESAANYAPDVWEVQRQIGAFDFVLDYRRKADITSSYLFSNLDSFQKIKSRPFEEMKDEPLFIASHCPTLSHREDYVEELMKYLTVHSSGKCLHTGKDAFLMPEDASVERYGNDANSAYQRAVQYHKFTLSFENSICDDYVTEKFWIPLLFGSIPVFLGTPTIRELAPHPSYVYKRVGKWSHRSFIFVDDFESPAGLAAHLRQVAKDPVALKSYQQWRSMPLHELSSGFQQLLQQPNPWCEMTHHIILHKETHGQHRGRAKEDQCGWDALIAQQQQRHMLWLYWGALVVLMGVVGVILYRRRK